MVHVVRKKLTKRSTRLPEKENADSGLVKTADVKHYLGMGVNLCPSLHERRRAVNQEKDQQIWTRK